jgi:Short C-terminal domain
MSFWEILLWTFWIFIWIGAIFIWFRCVFDMFSDHTLSGWGKAGWALFLIVLPWLGAFVYLIARGKSMNDRQMAAQADAKAQQDAYIQQVAAGSSDPTAQIASAKSLMDSGAISEAEYQALKAKALA